MALIDCGSIEDIETHCSDFRRYRSSTALGGAPTGIFKTIRHRRVETAYLFRSSMTPPYTSSGSGVINRIIEQA
jgi:hypothetical protein